MSKASLSVLGGALLVLALSILGRAVSAAVYQQRLSVCRSLYQIFGIGSVPAVNLITGIFTACLLTAIAIALFAVRGTSKNKAPSAGGLFFLKYVLIVAVIYTILGIFVSFGSVSVINYTDLEGYHGSVNYTATGLFWLTIVLGSAVLCSELAFIRLIQSLTDNLQSGSLTKKGTMLGFAAGLIGLVAGAFNACLKLYQLVTPPENYVQDLQADKQLQALSNAELLLYSFNVMIFAAAAAAFVCVITLMGSYAIHTDMTLRTARMSAYNNGHTVVNPEQIMDYTNDSNFNYHQSSGFTPYYKMNQSFQNIYKDIYTGEAPPAPQTVEMPFKPKTRYPAQKAAPPAEAASDSATVSADVKENVNEKA